MKWPKKGMHLFLVDANVFIAAIKNPDKKTRSLDLIVELIENEKIRFNSETASYLLKRLRDKITVIKINEENIKISSQYIPKTEIADLVHAATCLQENSILISNDKHFDKISENSVIEVWKISKAITNLL